MRHLGYKQLSAPDLWNMSSWVGHPSKPPYVTPSGSGGWNWKALRGKMTDWLTDWLGTILLGSGYHQSTRKERNVHNIIWRRRTSSSYNTVNTCEKTGKKSPALFSKFELSFFLFKKRGLEKIFKITFGGNLNFYRIFPSIVLILHSYLRAGEKRLISCFSATFTFHSCEQPLNNIEVKGGGH